MNYISVNDGYIKTAYSTKQKGSYCCGLCNISTNDFNKLYIVENPNYNQPTGEKRDVYNPDTGEAYLEDILDEREVLLLERPKTEEEIEDLRKAKVVSLLREEYSINDELKMINRALQDAKDSAYSDYRATVDNAKAEAQAWAEKEIARAASLQKELDKYTIVTGPKEEEDEEKVLDKQEVL